MVYVQNLLFILFSIVLALPGQASLNESSRCAVSLNIYKKTVKKFSPIEFSQHRAKVPVLRALAEKHFDEFERALWIISQKFNGVMAGPNLKSLESIESKADRKTGKYGHRTTAQIFDYLRGSVVFENFHDLYSAIKYVEQYRDVEIGALDDYILKPKDSGYRAVHFAVRFPDGFVAEVQFHLKSMFEVKHGEADALYSKIRELELEIEKLGKDLEEVLKKDSWKTNNMLLRAFSKPKHRMELQALRVSSQKESMEITNKISERKALLKELEEKHRALYEEALDKHRDELIEIFGEEIFAR